MGIAFRPQIFRKNKGWGICLQPWDTGQQSPEQAGGRVDGLMGAAGGQQKDEYSNPGVQVLLGDGGEEEMQMWGRGAQRGERGECCI